MTEAAVDATGLGMLFGDDRAGEPVVERDRAQDEPDAPTRRERVREWFESDDDTPIRPAAAKLSTDQAHLLADLLDGFADRGELIEWQQKLSIHSLGQLPDEFFRVGATDAATVAALIEEPWGMSDGYRPATAAEIRRGYAAEYVIPAFRAALRTFRWAAVERVEHLDDEIDEQRTPIERPEDMQWPAMRPELSKLSEHQETALSRLLEGFDSGEEMLLWGHKVTSASYAEIDEETIREAYFEEPTRRYLCDESADASKARFFREGWAATYLIPSFNAAARALAGRSTEVAKDSDADYTSGNQSLS